MLSMFQKPFFFSIWSNASLSKFPPVKSRTCLISISVITIYFQKTQAEEYNPALACGYGWTTALGGVVHVNRSCWILHGLIEELISSRVVQYRFLAKSEWYLYNIILKFRSCTSVIHSDIVQLSHRQPSWLSPHTCFDSNICSGGGCSHCGTGRSHAEPLWAAPAEK